MMYGITEPEELKDLIMSCIHKPSAGEAVASPASLDTPDVMIEMLKELREIRKALEKN